MPDTQMTKRRPTARRTLVGAAVALAVIVAATLFITKPWSSDPNASDRSSYDLPIDAWNTDLVSDSSPRFDCKVNEGKPRTTNGQVDKLIPCWTQSFHVIVDDKGQPRIGEYTKISGAATVEQKTHDEYDNYLNTGEDKWVFTVLAGDNSGKHSYDFSYLNGGLRGASQDWEIYYRLDDEAWRIAGNFDDYTTEPGQRMEAIIVFDPKKSGGELVRTPFTWQSVSKGWHMYHYANN